MRSHTFLLALHSW